MTFRTFDKVCDGHLSKQELQNAFNDYKVPIEEFELTELFRQID